MIISQCTSCGATDIPRNAVFCPSCGASSGEGRAEFIPTRQMNGFPPRVILAIAGSILLFLGVFAPIINVPIIGSINYFQNGRGDGVIILILAVVSFVLALTRVCRYLVITGGLSLGLLAFTLLSFQYRMSQAQASLDSKMSDNMFAGLGQAMLGSVQISWGFAVLALGGICVLVAGLWQGKEEPSVFSEAIEAFPQIPRKALYIALALVIAGWIGMLAYVYYPFSQLPAVVSPSPPPAIAPATNATASNSALNTAFQEVQRAANAASDAENRAAAVSQLPDQPAETLSDVEKASGLQTTTRATVISENANLRFSGDNSSEVIQVVPYGDELEIVKQRGPWFQVRYLDQIGWMHGNTIRILDAYE